MPLAPSTARTRGGHQDALVLIMELSQGMNSFATASLVAVAPGWALRPLEIATASDVLDVERAVGSRVP